MFWLKCQPGRPGGWQAPSSSTRRRLGAGRRAVAVLLERLPLLPLLPLLPAPSCILPRSLHCRAIQPRRCCLHARACPNLPCPTPRSSQGLASIGTLLEITDHANLEDGRMIVNNVGRQRFKILEVVEEKPVLICRVEYLPDEQDAGADTPEVRRAPAWLPAGLLG